MGRIDTLLAAMTLEEKIGQLNMVASTGVVTGPGELRDLHEGIRTGRIGNLLNLWGADETRAVQRLAVEESRLGVPLLHGPRRHPRPPHDLSRFRWRKPACSRLISGRRRRASPPRRRRRTASP